MMNLSRIFDQIGFHEITDPIFKKLVVYRLVYPVSKLKTTDYLRCYEQLDWNEDKLNRYMDKLYNTQKELAQRISYQHSLQVLGGQLSNESRPLKERILGLEIGDGQAVVLEKDSSLNLVISYSDKRAKKDKYNRQRGFNKLEKKLKTGRLTKAHITNTSLSKEQVIENYNHLWHIEKAFRVAKSELRLRPVYHRLQRRIEAHLCIAFVAYKVYKELECHSN